MTKPTFLFSFPVYSYNKKNIYVYVSKYNESLSRHDNNVVNKTLLIKIIHYKQILRKTITLKLHTVI